MRKFFSLIAAVLFAGSMMAADATMTAGTNGSAADVNGNAAIKVGTSKAGGDMTITVGAGATTLSFYAAAWNNVNGLSLNITAPDGVTVTPASVDLTMDPGISNNSPFTLQGTEADFKFDLVLTGVEAETTLTLAGATAKRFVVWGATYETGEVPPTPSVATPVIAGNESFEESTTVTITCATEGAAILYTTDDAAELNAFLAYTAALSLTESATVRAYAVLGEDTSAVVSKTFTKEEPAVLVQYEVAEAIAAGLTDGTEIEVRGVITKMEMKGKNFAKYGSVNVYVADATGAAGEFEFYNCYSMNADTFKVTVPAHDATSSTMTEVTEVSDAKGYTLHVGDTVIAHGNYKLFNTTHELNTGCYIVYAKVPGALYPTNIENAATEQKAVKFFENGQLFINKNGVIYNAQGTIVR